MGTANPFLYRGYYYDSETGLYYLNSRYYDPQTGRFINADDVSTLQAAQGDVLGANLFAYCENNPVMNADPDGDFVQFIVGAAIGGVLFLVSYFLDSYLSHTQIIWWKAMLSLGSGAASGVLAASGVGLVEQIMGNVSLSVGGLLANGSSVTQTDVMIAIMTGIICGIAGELA